MPALFYTFYSGVFLLIVALVICIAVRWMVIRRYRYNECDEKGVLLFSLKTKILLANKTKPSPQIPFGETKKVE